MNSKYEIPKYKILPEKTISKIHDSSISILEKIGCRIKNKRVWPYLLEFGAEIDKENSVVRFPESIVNKAIDVSKKKHTLYGRNHDNKACYGQNTLNFNGSGGQTTIVDQRSKTRRDPDINDLRNAIKIGDALNNINVVGAMIVPSDIPPQLQSIITFFELLNGTTKPFIGFIFSKEAAKAIIEMMAVVKGSKENLRKYPPYEAFIEPISPLTFTDGGIDILMEFAENDLPVGFGPMVQVGATGPMSLLGTIAQEHAEILAGITIAQSIKPGLAVTYAGIPHIMDMKTAMISLGSPEQGLMAAAITQLAKSFDFPVYNNTGLCDAKISDFQAGLEKGAIIILGALAGGDIFGHLGISGADNGASFTQLILDNEMAGYVKRVVSGFGASGDSIPLDIIEEVGIGGNYLNHPETFKNFKKEVWYPEMFDRFIWDTWEQKGKKSILDIAFEKEISLLKNHDQDFMDEGMQKECKKIIESYSKEIGIK